MATRDDRREENQKHFRRGNERLHEALEDKVADIQTVPFLCECADEECVASVEVRPSQWEAIAGRPRHYLMVGGHLRSEGEDVVGSLGPYQIVVKPD